MVVEFKDISFSKIEEIKDEHLDIFYEEGIHPVELYIDNKPIAVFNHREKNDIVDTRNFYIYEEHRNKGLMKKLWWASLKFIKLYYPSSRIIWWSTKFDTDVANNFAKEIFTVHYTETKNPNAFGFVDPAPNYFYWSYIDEMSEKFEDEMNEVEVKYDLRKR